MQRLWQRNIFDAEILKSEFDAGGYDLVLSFRDVTRHIQLKVSRDGGARSDLNISLRLAEKPSGCVVWIVVDDDLCFKAFRWYGGAPGSGLPDISGNKVVKHTKGNAQGIKNERVGHRIVPGKSFVSVATIDDLISHLLGNGNLEP